jgi:hypothetical protein
VAARAITSRTKRLKSSFSKSLHLNSWEITSIAVRGKFMITMIGRAQLYEAVALAVFAGLVLLSTVQIVPAIVD